MIEWKKAHDISKAEKRKKSSNEKAELECRKRRISGKWILYYHTIDEKFHDNSQGRCHTIFLPNEIY